MRCLSVRSLASVITIFGALLFSGCEDKNANQLASATTGSDMSGIASATIAVDTAAEFGLFQLYQGSSAIAGVHSPAPAIVLRDVVSDGPGIPVAQSVIIDGAALALGLGGTATGNLAFTSDQLAPDASTLPSNWWHVQLVADGMTTSFAVTADDGAVATLSAGTLDCYVLDGTTTVTSAGNWTQTTDLWIISRASAPVTVNLVALGASLRTTTVSGIRHVHHVITRTDDGTVITRVDNGTIDGDASVLLSAVPSLATLGVTSGPTLNDSNLPGGPRIFSTWRQPTQLGTGATHTWTFNRIASWTLSQSKLVVPVDLTIPATWTSATALFNSGSFYIERDGVREGPYNNNAFINRWGLVLDLTRSGRRL